MFCFCFFGWVLISLWIFLTDFIPLCINPVAISGFILKLG